MRQSLLALAIVMIPVTSVLATPADPPKFERIVIDNDFPGAYQVEVADVNGDKKPDVIVVGGGTCAWYENPTWKKRIVTTPKQTPGIISSATADLDGDGKAEIAIAYEFAMNEPKKGKLLLAKQGKTADDPWTTRALDQDPSFPLGSIHRLRWGNLFGDGRPALVVAPIFNTEAKPPKYDGPARLFLHLPRTGRLDDDFEIMTHVVKEGHPVMHAIEVRDANGDGREDILTASNAGVTLVSFTARSGDWRFQQLVTGRKGEAPKQGSSEVHLGGRADGRKLLATIEPWHGSEVAVYLSDAPKSLNFGPRTVIDDTLDEGHALWVADIDGDGTDEVFAGHRGKDHRVSMYQFDGKTWNKTVLDRDIAAQDMRGGDLNGDGKPDVVAVGGSTHNVVWYRFK